MITIMLPWPDKDLSPNARVHWSKRADAVAQAKQAGYLLAFGENGDGLEGDLVAHYIFHPPNNYRRDIDNCLSSNKAHQDGVCQALGIDDSRIKRTVLEWGARVEHGSVELRIGAIDAD